MTSFEIARRAYRRVRSEHGLSATLVQIAQPAEIELRASSEVADQLRPPVAGSHDSHPDRLAVARYGIPTRFHDSPHADCGTDGVLPLGNILISNCLPGTVNGPRSCARNICTRGPTLTIALPTTRMDARRRMKDYRTYGKICRQPGDRLLRSTNRVGLTG